MCDLWKYQLINSFATYTKTNIPLRIYDYKYSIKLYKCQFPQNILNIEIRLEKCLILFL